MVTVSVTRQPEFVIEPLDEMRVRVTFYTSEEEIMMEDGVHYQYDMYRTETINRPGLAEYISENLDAWVTAAKAAEEEKHRTEEALAVEREINRELAGILLDYDFRLMMLEELGTKEV